MWTPGCLGVSVCIGVAGPTVDLVTSRPAGWQLGSGGVSQVQTEYSPSMSLVSCRLSQISLLGVFVIRFQLGMGILAS